MDKLESYRCLVQKVLTDYYKLEKILDFRFWILG
jgi:hypothetical protein